MTKAEQKIVQYLDEAHASEVGLVRDLQAQIAMTPRGGYRSALQSHLRETREHARLVRERARELGRGADLVAATVGFAESVVAQLLALGKAPLSILRGGSGEERVLKNAKDACASEALEIATYTAIERLARSVGDETTAELAASIREQEERMLERVLREIPKLTAATVGSEVREQPSHELGKTGAAGTGRNLLNEPWPGYDEQSVEEIRKALSDASAQRAKEVQAYERSHKNRSGVVTAAEREAA